MANETVRFTTVYSVKPNQEGHGHKVIKTIIGPTAHGSQDLAVCPTNAIADFIATALNEYQKRLENKNRAYVCSHCGEPHGSKPRACIYCGKKPETSQ